MTRCGGESPHLAEWAPGPPVEQERHNADGHKSGGQYIAVLFGLQLPLTQTTLSNKVRGTYFSKNCVARLHCLVVIIIVSLCSA